MNNAIIITNTADIPIAQTVANSLAEHKFYIFDPMLEDYLIANNITSYELIVWDNSLDFIELDKWSHSVAFDIERELDRSVREIVPEVSIYSWQHLNYWYFFQAARWYSCLWGKVLKHFVDCKLHVMVSDNPAEYYFASFIPALFLMQRLQQHNIPFQSYTYGKKEDDTSVIPDLPGAGDVVGPHSILVHIPTCFYDYSYFNNELLASGKNVINLESKFKSWDVPVTAATSVGITRIEDLDDTLFGNVREKAERFSSVIYERLESLLVPYIAPEIFRSRQCRHFSNIYKSQLVTFLMMEEYFNKQGRPSKVLISDHDTGFHGPIHSFARKYDIPVLMVPHSKVIPLLEFDRYNVTCLTHPIQGESITDCNGRGTLNFNLAYPENLVGSTIFPEQIKRVGLLLNSLGLNGVASGRYSSYLNGIKQIVQWCKNNNIQIGIRSRPREQLISRLSQETGFDQGEFQKWLKVSIVDFAKGHDICLMYGPPTTAAITFLQHSIPILNPLFGDIPKSEASVANTRVIPRGSVTTILGMLDSFVADPTNFFLFRNSQFNNYVSSFNNALPLRNFL